MSVGSRRLQMLSSHVDEIIVRLLHRWLPSEAQSTVMVSVVIKRVVIILVSVTNVMAVGVIEQVNKSDSEATELLCHVERDFRMKPSFLWSKLVRSSIRLRRHWLSVGMKRGLLTLRSVLSLVTVEFWDVYQNVLTFYVVNNGENSDWLINTLFYSVSFWIKMLCKFLGHKHFGGTYRLHLQRFS